MKILILYRYSKNSSFNHWCNVDFYKELNSFENVEAKLYGINATQLFPEIAIPYNSKLTLKDLRNIFDFDVIIIAGRNRTFVNYKEDNCWLPKDFYTIDCPKVLVEPDYHKYRKLKWIEEANIKLILHRHKSNVVRAEEDFTSIRSLWFPFSVDESIFKPDESIERINKICFVGNSKSKSYYYRQNAIEYLEKENLCVNEGIQKEEKYIPILQKYKAYLNGASVFTIDCAKSFEILASGGILFTNNAYNGFKDLFDGCYITYENDYSDIIKQANYVLNDKILCEHLAYKGRQKILHYHTHKHRAKNLIDILQKEIFDKNKERENKNVDVVYNIGNLDDEVFKRFQISYLSLSLNKNYNIKISEVGKTSSYDKIKSFISNFEYHYQKSENFDASIAKNNAFKYLIKSNLFTFLDIDMIVSNNFVEKITNFYNRHRKAFICPYIRLKKTHETDYNQIMSNINNIGEEKITHSGVLVCDKKIYKELNGFDEEYEGWGGRDSDFYKRAKLINKFITFYNYYLLHQYHKRNFGKYKEQNKNRFNHRSNEYYNNKSLICKFKGLVDNTKDNLSQLRLLLNNDVSVCLLKKTCYEAITGKDLTFPLTIAVSDKEKASSIINFVNLESYPPKTKKIKINDLIIDVPFPVVSYLRRFYPNIDGELKK